MEWLHGIVHKVEKEAIFFGREAIDDTWQPPSMAQAWHTKVPLEKIRFAAANRLCVNLYYKNSHRLIEPYSLRRSKAGNLLLFAVRHNTNEPRSYRVDRIQNAKISNTSFVPKHAVELTPSGPISAPQLAGTSRVTYPRSRITQPTVRHSRTKKPDFGPKHVFRCTICRKLFYRKKYNNVLNPHKNKQGYPCSGRTGIFVKTKY